MGLFDTGQNNYDFVKQGSQNLGFYEIYSLSIQLSL